MTITFPWLGKLRESLTIPSNMALTASPFFVFMLSPLDETSHLPTGSGKEYSFSLSEEKSTVKDLDFEKSPGVEMFICCFSAGEKS